MSDTTQTNDSNTLNALDYISRREAVSAISDLLMLELKGKRLPTWNEVYRAINAVPSAQPETRWVSCEKWLPTQEGEYLVCDHNERVFIAKFWTTFGEWSDKDIIAWQERPEPYREETEDDTRIKDFTKVV